MRKNLIDNNLWNKLTGSRSEFSMESRAFNAVSIISFFIILYSLVFDLFIAQWLMCGVLCALMLILVVLYYYSRYKRKSAVCIIIYASCSYLAIIANYFCNSGIQGPTLLLFCLTIQLLVGISPPKYYKIWITLHVLLVAGLLYCEYNFQALVPYTYANKFENYLDIFWTYVSAIVFIILVTNYLRKNYHTEKQLSDARLLELEAQHNQIAIQNEQLEQINQEKNKLFSIVSHDLRGPIDSLKGYLEILSENELEVFERKELESDLLEHVNYTSDLLLNLLFWSRAQMKGVNVNLVPVKLMELLDDARSFRMAGTVKKGIKLTYSIATDVEVIADKEMLRIVIRNLVTNAIKFTKPGGEISIQLQKKGDMAEISIHDNGIGIPIEKQGEIFTFKSHSTYGTNAEKGVGMGLMLCKEFMEYQNGKITFDSKPGVGTVFYLTLPLARM